MATTQKRLLVMILGAMAGVVMVASVAFACAAITTIKLQSSTAAAGETLEGRGDAFRSGDGFGPVVLHWESRSGAQLWTGEVPANRVINFSFTVPDVAPGHYALIATQNSVDGKPVAGSPARTTLQVTAGGAASAVTQPEAAGSGAAPAPAAPVEEAAAPAAAPVQASASEPAAAAPQAATTAPAAATTSEPASAATAPAAASTSQPTQAAPAPAVDLSALAATPKQFVHEATVSPAASALSSLSAVPAVREVASSSAPALGGSLGLPLLAAVLGMGTAVLFLARKRRSIGMAVARF